MTHSHDSLAMSTQSALYRLEWTTIVSHVGMLDENSELCTNVKLIHTTQSLIVEVNDIHQYGDYISLPDKGKIHQNWIRQQTPFVVEDEKQAGRLAVIHSITPYGNRS